MKKKFFKYIPIALGAIMMMASCADDDEENPQNNDPTVPKPTIEVSVNGEANLDIYEVTTGDTIILEMTALTAAGGGAKLDVVSLSQSGTNLSNNISMTASGSGDPYDFFSGADVDIKNADNENLSLSGTFHNITSSVGETTYEFTVKDKDGLIAKKSFKIQVSDPTTPFTSTNTGEIWHIKGLKRGSWSLTGDSSISAVGGQNENEAHIINTNAAGVTFTGSFKVGDNVSNTTFVKAASSFDYANATLESAEAAYIAGTASTSTTTAPTVDDVYIYELSNGNNIVVKITSIDLAADCGAGCNNPGKLDFEYKK
jgi:hypothetical protein